MTKLNGIESVGSVVEYMGNKCVIFNAESSDWNGVTHTSYVVREIDGSYEYHEIVESSLKVLIAKSPLKKHLNKLIGIDKKITKQNAKLEKEMKEFEKRNGWDDGSIPYDHYADEHGNIMDGISYWLGLDYLHEERYVLVAEMVESARKVKALSI